MQSDNFYYWQWLQIEDAELQIGKFRIHWDTSMIAMKAAAATEKDVISKQLKAKQLEMDDYKQLNEEKTKGEYSDITVNLQS